MGLLRDPRIEGCSIGSILRRLEELVSGFAGFTKVRIRMVDGGLSKVY